MAVTSLIITSTTAVGGKKLQKTLTDINPAATNDQLKDFAQQLNGLTTNTYSESNRLDKINCDTEESDTGKKWGGITTENITRGSSTAAAIYATDEGSTATPLIFFYSSGTVTNITSTFQQGDTETQGKAVFTIPNSAGYLYIGFTESSNFYSELIVVQVS